MPWNYKPFSSLNDDEKKATANNYSQKFRDFDNDIIVNSALKVLHDNGITDVSAIQVGPERAGDAFDLDIQLINKVSDDNRFTIFSLPTFGGRHSVGVVIDTENRECQVIDSLNQFYPEAVDQVQGAIDAGVLDGYKVITPSSYVVQQKDTWSCGVHTSANMVGIITGDINLKTNAGISQRSADEVTNLLGIFSKAYADISIERASELNNPRLNARQKKVVRFALDAIDASSYAGTVNSDIKALISALREELPPGIDDAELLKQRPFTEFLNEFSEKNPGNTIVPLLSAADFAQNLPATMEDNIEEKELIVQQYITTLLKTPPVLEVANAERIREADVPTEEGIKRTTEKEELLPAVENKNSVSEAYKKLQTINFDRYLAVIEMKKDKYKNSDRPDYKSAVTAAGTLHDALTSAKSNFLQSQEPMNRAWPEFKTACLAAIDNSRAVLEQHRGWKQILADICSAIVSVVSLGLANYAVKNGMFGLFPTKTDSAEKLDELADSLDKGPKKGM